MLKGTPKDTKTKITLLGLSLAGEQPRERTPTLYRHKISQGLWDEWVPLNQNVYQKVSAQNRCTNSKLILPGQLFVKPPKPNHGWHCSFLTSLLFFPRHQTWEVPLSCPLTPLAKRSAGTEPRQWHTFSSGFLHLLKSPGENIKICPVVAIDSTFKPTGGK